MIDTGDRILLIMVITIIGGSIVNKVVYKNTLIRVLAFIAFGILIHLLLTVISPSWTPLLILAIDDINTTTTTSDLWSIRGQIGDVLAGHFTALAVIGLAITITQMKESLDKQDKLLDEQKSSSQKQINILIEENNEAKERHNATMDSQKEITDAQLAELNKQSFENQFFQRLEIFNKVIDNLLLSDKSNIEVIRELHRHLLCDYLQDSVYKKLEDFQEDFNDFNNEFDTTFKYYFINLYQLIKFVDDKYGKDKKEATMYINLIRAQLSKDELVLLFYNACMIEKFSGNNYKILVERYAFFEHLRYEDLKKCKEKDTDYNTMADILIRIYKKEAFGTNIALEKKWEDLNAR